MADSRMTQKLSGGCACGAIHYDCNADPLIMFNCHCRDCQRASGSAYAAIVVVPKAAVQMRGEPRYPWDHMDPKVQKHTHGAPR